MLSAEQVFHKYDDDGGGGQKSFQPLEKTQTKKIIRSLDSFIPLSSPVFAFHYILRPH